MVVMGETKKLVPEEPEDYAAFLARFFPGEYKAKVERGEIRVSREGVSAMAKKSGGKGKGGKRGGC